jgi:uncharacterized protein
MPPSTVEEIPMTTARRTIALLAALAPAARAVEAPPPRQITVTGEAEVKVAPDQVLLTLAVETSDKDLVAAQRQNDERVKRVLALAAQFKIDPRHVQTAEISLQPRYETVDRKRVFLGYFATRTIVICLKEMTRFEDLLSSALRAGTNNVEGVDFQSTQLRKFRDQARALAVRAAREKATAMAGELGQKLGRPRTITENSSYASARRGNYQVQNVNASMSEPTASEGSDSFAPGQIGITASVTVTFDLAD